MTLDGLLLPVPLLCVLRLTPTSTSPRAHVSACLPSVGRRNAWTIVPSVALPVFIPTIPWNASVRRAMSPPQINLSWSTALRPVWSHAIKWAPRVRLPRSACVNPIGKGICATSLLSLPLLSLLLLLLLLLPLLQVRPASPPCLCGHGCS